MAQQNATLPIFGFQRGQTFASLVRDNHFLFRVHDDSKPYSHPVRGIGFKSSNSSNLHQQSQLERKRDCFIPAPDDAYKHIMNIDAANSPYISTTFSMAWALCEAVRRVNVERRRHVEISVIRARELEKYASLGRDLLPVGFPWDETHYRCWNFTNAAQEVLIPIFIPANAIVSTIPWSQVFSAIPYWFVTEGPRSLRKGNIPPGATPVDIQKFNEAAAKPRLKAFAMSFGYTHIDLCNARIQALRLAMEFTALQTASVGTMDNAAVQETMDLAFEIFRWPTYWLMSNEPTAEKESDLQRWADYAIGVVLSDSASTLLRESR
jgi:hypothetical protein